MVFETGSTKDPVFGMEGLRFMSRIFPTVPLECLAGALACPTEIWPRGYKTFFRAQLN